MQQISPRLACCWTILQFLNGSLSLLRHWILLLEATLRTSSTVLAEDWEKDEREAAASLGK
jgi:hypothetical protein